ncbi:MAG: hypothetical protein IT336_08365 [Thermomicrobiales bacterium]|nr:hypothetical protein [Thermomicrobiales bacterium]
MFDDAAWIAIARCGESASQRTHAKEMAMKTTRWLAIIAIVSMVSIPALVTAQEATPESTAVNRANLFEISILPDWMPPDLGQIVAGPWQVEAGVDVEIAVTNEAILGRLMYVEVGSLDVWPVIDSPVWRGDKVFRDAPTIVPGGEQVHLETGDAMFLPGISPTDLNQDDIVRISNPGTEPTLTYSVHMHQVGGQFTGWPRGIRDLDSETTVNGMAAIQSEGVTYRLDQLTAEPGASIAVDEGASSVIYQTIDGTVELNSAGPGGDYTTRWPAGQGGVVQPLPNVTNEVHVVGDGPATFYELDVFPLTTPEATPAANEG